MTIEEQYEKIKENIPKVYEAGYEKGKADGDSSQYDEGFEDGKQEGVQTERQRFWGNYLDYGNRTSFANAFAGFGWNGQTFEPPYDLIVKASAQNMFNGTAITDVTAALEKMGVELDTSQATSVNYMFGHSSVTRVPKISIKTCNSIIQLFYNANKLHTIEGLEFSDTKVQTFTNMFNYCKSLVNINEVKGTIQSDINFGDCPLNKESFNNIFPHLLEPSNTEWIQTDSTRWERQKNGAYPFDAIKVEVSKDVFKSGSSGHISYGKLDSIVYWDKNLNSSGVAILSGSGDNGDLRHSSLYIKRIMVDGTRLDKSQYTVYESRYTQTNTITVNQSAVKKAFETTSGAMDGDTSSEWLALISTRPNWAIEYK